ncbi:MAG: hypothetical protein IJS29_08890 [Selenomonadaceae bacterium]|nr:hypothetical protein [Selenomonadaceae bacterium]
MEVIIKGTDEEIADVIAKLKLKKIQIKPIRKTENLVENDEGNFIHTPPPFFFEPNIPDGTTVM